MSDFVFCPRCAAPLIDKRVDGEPRRACSAGCGFVHYDNPVPVVAAVVEHEGRVVLARNRAWPQTWYGLITGFLERGEAPAQGAIREVKEELGLDATQVALIGVYTFERMNQVIIAYHVPAAGAITLNEELVDYRRVPPEQCYAWHSGTGHALRDWLRSRGFDPPVIERPRRGGRPPGKSRVRKSTLRLLIMILPAAAVAAGTVRAEPFLWQTNSGGTDIHVYGIEDFQLVRRLEVGPEPHGIAAPSDGRVVYVSLEANGRDHGELLWINPRTFVIEHRLKVGPEPHAIATTPDGKWIYVPCRDGHYWVVDAEAKRVVKQIYTGGRPHNTQASSDGRYMYLSPMGRPKGVTVVDIPAQHAIVGFIPFAESVRPSALSRDGRLLFQHVDGLNGFQAAETSQRKVVATVTHSSTLGWLMPLKRLGYLSTGGFKRCHGLAVRPVDEELWSVCAEYLAIHRLEPPTFTETALVELPAKAYWLTFSLDGRYAFIALSDQNQVAVMDAAKKQIVRRLAAGWAPKRNLVLAR